MLADTSRGTWLALLVALLVVLALCALLARHGHLRASHLAHLLTVGAMIVVVATSAWGTTSALSTSHRRNVAVAATEEAFAAAPSLLHNEDDDEKRSRSYEAAYADDRKEAGEILAHAKKVPRSQRIYFYMHYFYAIAHQLTKTYVDVSPHTPQCFGNRAMDCSAPDACRSLCVSPTAPIDHMLSIGNRDNMAFEITSAQAWSDATDDNRRMPQVHKLFVAMPPQEATGSASRTDEASDKALAEAKAKGESAKKKLGSIGAKLGKLGKKLGKKAGETEAGRAAQARAAAEVYKAQEEAARVQREAEMAQAQAAAESGSFEDDFGSDFQELGDDMVPDEEMLTAAEEGGVSDALRQTTAVPDRDALALQQKQRLDRARSMGMGMGSMQGLGAARNRVMGQEAGSASLTSNAGRAVRTRNLREVLAKNTQHFEVQAAWVPLTVGSSQLREKRILYRVKWNARTDEAFITAPPAVTDRYELTVAPAPGRDSHMVEVRVREKASDLNCAGWTQNFQVFLGRRITGLYVPLQSLWTTVWGMLMRWHAQRKRVAVVVDSLRPLDHDGTEYTNYNYGLTQSLARLSSWGRGQNAFLSPIHQLVIAFAEFEDAAFQNFSLARSADDAIFMRDLTFLSRFHGVLRVLNRHFFISAMAGNVEEAEDPYSPRRPRFKVQLPTQGTAFALLQPMFQLQWLSRLQVTYVSRKHFTAKQHMRGATTAMRVLPPHAKAAYDQWTAFASPYAYAGFHRHRDHVRRFVRGASNHATLKKSVQATEDKMTVGTSA